MINPKIQANISNAAISAASAAKAAVGKMQGTLNASKTYTLHAMNAAKDKIENTVAQHPGKTAIAFGVTGSALVGGGVTLAVLATLTGGIALAVVGALALTFAIYKAVQMKLANKVEKAPVETTEAPKNDKPCFALVEKPAFTMIEVVPAKKKAKTAAPSTLKIEVLNTPSKTETAKTTVTAPVVNSKWKTASKVALAVAVVGLGLATYQFAPAALASLV